MRNGSFLQELRGPSLPITVAFRFAIFILRFDGKGTAAFTDLHEYSHLVVECYAKTTTFDDNSRDFTACFLKQRFLSKSFPKALHTMSV